MSNAPASSTEAPKLPKPTEKAGETLIIAPHAGFEKFLQEKSKNETSPIVQGLIRQLSSAVVYTDCGNVETNRKLWDQYAKNWGVEKDWVKRMVSHLPKAEAEKIRLIGDEWSNRAHLVRVIDEFIKPFITADSNVAEIGSGGGRLAVQVLPWCSSLHCFDISIEMLKNCRAAVQAASVDANASMASRCRFTHMSEKMDIGEKYAAQFDFLYIFDVLVHVDLHTTWKLMKQIRSMLKPSGKAFLSTATVTTPGGWQRFSKQRKYSVGGFYFSSPETIRALVQRAGLRIVKESKVDATNVYYNRDFLFVVQPII